MSLANSRNNRAPAAAGDNSPHTLQRKITMESKIASEEQVMQRAALEKFPTEAYSANVLTDCFEDAKRLFLESLIEVHYAHAIMLAEQQIITSVEVKELLQALDGLDHVAIRATEYDGSFEDLFFYIEELLKKACGDDIAGRLHTARSRNDIDVTIYRMRLRIDALRVAQSAMSLRGVLLDVAERHHETIMPAYTHTQPAQPTTLAHFVLAMAEVLGRDIERLRRATDAINYSPLGSCAITTTGFPINRERTASLLGFDGCTVNSYAGIGAVDYFTELLAAVAVLMVNAGKFVQEFLLMAMREFGAINLSDGYVQSSSIMPQKRNPVALEHVRILASKAFAQATGVMSAIHNTPFGDINDVEDDLQPMIAQALRDAVRSLSLFSASLDTATFNVDILRRRAAEGFITVTELADTIVRREGLSFKLAHKIVARSVRLAIDASSDITYDIFRSAAREVTGEVLSISSAEFDAALDPEHFVRVRTILGGPAPAETRRAAAVEREKERFDKEWYERRSKALEDYKFELRAAADNVINAQDIGIR
jgi:argininosuccinate lyase